MNGETLVFSFSLVALVAVTALLLAEDLLHLHL